MGLVVRIREVFTMVCSNSVRNIPLHHLNFSFSPPVEDLRSTSQSVPLSQIIISKHGRQAGMSGQWLLLQYHLCRVRTQEQATWTLLPWQGGNTQGKRWHIIWKIHFSGSFLKNISTRGRLVDQLALKWTKKTHLLLKTPSTKNLKNPLCFMVYIYYWESS